MRLAVLGLVIVLAAVQQRVTLPDLAYGPDARHRLDLTVPPAKNFPTILFVHGGSLTTGDKADEDYRAVCAPFAATGIACASMNYRLLQTAPWPAPAQDVASAVVFTLSQIDTHGGNRSNLFLVGHSSGANLVALIGSNASYLAAHRLSTDVIRGVVAIGSIMWDDELEQAIAKFGVERVTAAFFKDPDNRHFASLEDYRNRWPIRHVRKGMPPMLFLMGDAEQHQPPILHTSRTFVDEARVLGNVADYRVVDGRRHYDMIRRLSDTGDPVFTSIREFVQAFSR